MVEHWGDFVAEKTRSVGELCVGIDPVPADIPEVFRRESSHPADVLQSYAGFLLDAIRDQVAFIKPQSAFFEAFGSRGVAALAGTIQQARRSGIGVIADVKRGDIGSTAAAYAQAYLTPDSGSDLEADCMTLNPFLGPDTLEPFLQCARKYGKGLFILAKTSNPGSGWLQDQFIEGNRVSDRVGALVASWAEGTTGKSGLSSVGAVVGVTYPEDGKRLRELMPGSILLVPGLGPQGGKSEDILAMRRPDGGGVLVPVSRGITRTSDLAISKDAYAELIRERIAGFRQSLLAR